MPRAVWRQPAAHIHIAAGAAGLKHAWSMLEMWRERPHHRPAQQLLAEARKLTTSREILLWMTPSEAPKALQASECSELLDPMRASCWISAQH